MNEKVIPDIDERNQIVNELDKNMLVEAGAGSGKTTSIVNRMVSLVISGKCKVENMAAITFTRKAAQELKERFQNELERRYREEENTAIKSALKEALENMEKSFIGTIHSFCASLLRERPVEGGVDPDFEEMDELTDKLMHKQAWQQYLLDIRKDFPEKLAELNDIGIKPADMEEIFNLLTEYPDVEVVRSRIQKPDLMPVVKELKKLLYRARHYIPKTEPEKGYDSLQSKIMDSVRMLSYFDMDTDINRVSILERFENEQRVILNRWLCDSATTKQIQGEFNTIAQTQIKPALQKWREYCHDVVMSFLLPAVEYYENLKARRSGLTSRTCF